MTTFLHTFVVQRDLMQLALGRISARFALAVAALATLFAGCDRMLVEPASGLSGGLALALAPSGSAALAEGADRARIRLTNAGETVVDTTVALPAEEKEVRVRLEVPLQADSARFEVRVELREGDRMLSRAVSDVTIRAGATSTAAVDPISVPGSVAAGYAHACYLDPTGQAFCWGANSRGQLGNGSTNSATTPVRVAGGLSFRALAAGGDVTCGIALDGSLHCWGDNAVGQLGNGGTAQSATPTPVSGGRSYRALSVGSQHGCALATDGAVYCWGQNRYGQLGASTGNDCTTSTGSQFACSRVPVRAAGATTYSSISAGGFHNCALSDSGEASCWGFGTFGQLGVNGNTNSTSPVTVSGGLRFTALAGGGASHCGLTTAGAVHCWGYGNFGQLGNGATALSRTPVPVAGGQRFVSIASQHENSILGAVCGLTESGAVNCWGANQSAQTGTRGGDLCGAGAQLIHCHKTPAPMTGGPRFVSIAMGLEHSCGQAEDGATYCWGSEYDGRLGNGATGIATAPVRVAGTATYRKAVAALGDHSCGITSDGRAVCWGSNIAGQLGTGDLAPSTTPRLVTSAPPFAALDAGSNFTCGTDAGGAAYCWGANNFGQLGDGTTLQRSAPVAVTGGHQFASISLASTYADAVTSAGVRHWWGQGGAGDAGTNPTPQPVPDTVPFQASAAGGNHTCVLATDGRALCRGDNAFGQLGIGGNAPTGMPTPVVGGQLFVQLVAGNRFTCGLATDGAAYCWGLNGSGQLGTGSTENRDTPTRVAGGQSFDMLSAGESHVCGVTTTGAAVCWGDNFTGQLGNPARGFSTSPVAVSGGLSFGMVSAGSDHSCGVTTAGVAYCWGAEGGGQLGDGSEAIVATPVRVGAAASPSRLVSRPASGGRPGARISN